MEEKTIIRFEDFNSICRLCLKHGELQNFDAELYQFYKLCINTYEDHTVGLPSNICKSCKFHLENIFTFLGKCKTNESLLHEVYSSKVPKQDSTINYQELIKAEVLDSCVLSNGDRVKHQILDTEKYTVSGEFKVLKDQILDPKALEILSQNDPKEQYIQKCDDTLNIQDHNKLLFTCSKCNKIFTTLELLITHMRQHDNRKPYACSYCEKSFTRSNDLKIHHRIHTGERPFECSYCHKTFKRSYDLKTHTWEHDGRKPHICSYCSKAYSRSYDLKIHLRVHTGERPFKCSSCDKTFKAVNDMNKHKRLHTGERPYVCSYCDKTFTQSSHFKAHVRQHLKE